MSGALPESETDADPHPDGNAAVAPPRRAFDARARAVETLVLAASVVALRALGLLLLVASSYGFGSLDSLVPFVSLILDANLLVWILLVVAVQFGFRSMRRPGRWALVVAAAPVAVVVATAARTLPGNPGAGIGAVMGNSPAWIDAGILTLVVALAVVFAASLLGGARGERRVTAAAAAGLLALGGLLTLVLVYQAFVTYFTLWGAPVEVTQADADRYLITAGITLVAFVAALVLAVLSRRRGLVITASIVGCLGLIIAFAVQVPAGRFVPGPPPAPAMDEQPGGACFGEGDPNCVGG
jgi:hypothetical protein